MRGEFILKNIKKLVYLFILMMVFIPLNVLGATSATLALTCDNNVNKGATVNCSLKVTATGGTITAITGTISVNDYLANASNISKSGLNIESGSSDTIPFTITAKEAAGKGTVTVNQIAGTATETIITEENETECNASSGSWNATSSTCTVTNTNEVTTFSPTEVSKDVAVLDNVAGISAITIDGKADSTCTKGTTGRTCQLVKNAETITIDVKASNNGTATTIGKKTLKCGSNTISTEVKAQDGTGKYTYTFTVNRTCNEDVTLKDIKVSAGTLTPTFSATTKEYTVEVTSEINKITITGEKNSSTQTITGNVTDRVLKYGDNEFSLVVTSEKGTKETYKVKVTRKDTRETLNTLSAIELSAGKLKFDKETTEYAVKVLHEVETIEVKATPESTKATIEIVNNNLKLVDGENKAILIKVKSENELEKTYKIVVTRLLEGETLGDNPNLSNIAVSNYNLGFTTTKDTYSLKIDKEKALTITATAEDPTTTFVITGNENLKNGSVIKITSTSQDGTVKTYVINIEKSSIMMFIIIGTVVVLLAIVVIVVLIIRNKKDKDFIETDKVKSKIKEEDLMARVQNQIGTIDSIPENPETEPISIAPQAYNAPSEPITEEMPAPAPQSEETKVCSICGHRVAASAQTCPYCKRSF